MGHQRKCKGQICILGPNSVQMDVGKGGWGGG